MIRGIKEFFWSEEEFKKRMPKKKINIIAGKNARLYEIFESPLGRLVTELNEVRELDNILPGFQLSVPKIPGQLLEQVVTFFRSYCNDKFQHEVLVEIYWDTVDRYYSVHVPFQSVSKTSIQAETEIRFDQRFIKFMQIHSHNTMRAEFSSVDNRDEVAFMVYGVIGCLHRMSPDLVFRVGRAGRFINIPVESVFDEFQLTKPVPYPIDWHLRVFQR